MSYSNLGMIDNLASKFSEDVSLKVFEKMCFVKYFEEAVKKAYDKKFIKGIPIYLSIGEESISSALSMVYEKPAIFAQHRAHGTYLNFGGDITALVDELLGLDTGCAHGMGGSASIHSPAIKMYGHDGHMGTQIPISVGYSIAKNENVLAVMGDASAEEDYVLGALGYACKKKAKVLFVCEDNDLSILTKVDVRRNWKMVDVARSFGMNAVDITDDPWLIMHHAKELINDLPAYLNIHTCRDVWHAGTGSDGAPEWNRFLMVKDTFKNLGLEKEIYSIESNAKENANQIWKERIERIGEKW